MKYQRGVSLIEVLIALVVFAIGIGGLAGLQLRSLSMSIDSTQRTVVLAKSQDLADRIRSNQGAIATYLGVYDNVGGYCATEPAINCADSNAGAAVACTAQQMAAFDLWDVFCRNRSGLNAGVAEWQTQVTCATSGCTMGDQITIATTWVSRTVDTNKDLNVAVGAAGVDPTLDRLILSFVP